MSQDLFSLTAVVGFLLAIMVVARACMDEGLFGAWTAVISRTTSSFGRRLLLTIVLIAVVTAVLTLHAAVVLLTPILLVTARTARRAIGLATVRVANTASTLLPTSNLTNLLAFAGTGLAFVEFAWLMLPAWALGVAAELVALRVWFSRDAREEPTEEVAAVPAVPLLPTAVVVAMLIGLSGGADLWLPALAAAILLGAYALMRRRTTWRDLFEAANVPLAGFVLV